MKLVVTLSIFLISPVNYPLRFALIALVVKKGYKRSFIFQFFGLCSSLSMRLFFLCAIQGDYELLAFLRYIFIARTIHEILKSRVLVHAHAWCLSVMLTASRTILLILEGMLSFQLGSLLSLFYHFFLVILLKPVFNKLDELLTDWICAEYPRELF